MKIVVLLPSLLLTACAVTPVETASPPAGCSVELKQLRQVACAAQKLAFGTQSQAAITDMANATAKLAEQAAKETQCPASYSLDPCSEP